MGPTDLPAGSDPDAVKTAPDEISYLLDSVRRSLPDFPARYDFITLGARPILGQAGNEKLLSREYEVFDHRKRDGIDGLLTIGGGKMSDFRVMSQAVVDAACARLGVKKPCATHLETLAGEALSPAQEPPQPSRLMKRFLRKHPRIREAHAMAYLAGAFARHLARRAFQSQAALAAELKAHYGVANP